MAHPYVPPAGGAGSQPGQGGQPVLHPTVPFGQPGSASAVVLPPNAPMPPAGPPVGFQPQTGQQPPAPPGGSTFPAGTQPPFQNGQPAPTVQPTQAPQNVRIPDNFVFDGDNVPAELRGRTWSQVRGVYGALAQEFIQRPGAVPAPRPNSPTPAAAPAPTVQQENAARVTTFWEDPEAAIERVVERRLTPVTQRTAAMAIQDAQSLARSQIPDFSQLEAEMIPTLRAAPPELLADPNFWLSTADLARGRLMGQGRYQFAGRQPAGNQPPQTVQNQVVIGYNQQGQPIYGYPAPPEAPPGPGSAVPAQHQFFTEPPTPPNGNNFLSGSNPNQWELTPEQKMYAQKMEMTEQQYRDWSGGIQRPGNARRW